MLTGFLTLLGFLLAGEIAVFLAAIPLPGPVVGMALMLLWLLWRSGKTPKPPESLEQATQALLQFLSLLFVPAGVGIVQRLGILEANVLGVVAIVLVTTAFSITVTAFTFRVVSRWFPASAEGAE